MHMRDWVARVLRTFIQGAVGSFFLLYSTTLFKLVRDFASLGPGDNLPELPDMNFFRNMLFAMAAGGVIASMSLLWNGIEQWIGKGILKPESPPTPKAVEPVANV